MIWIIRLFLFLYAVLYIALGGWAVIEPVRMMISDDFPSFMQAVGLSVTSPIGYSEVAGIYGGINIMKIIRKQEMIIIEILIQFMFMNK